MLKRARRAAFRLLYNQCAFAYDLVSRCVSLGRWRDWQRSVMPCLPPASAGIVLDLAHGTGELHSDLLRAGYGCVGLDLSPQMGRLAQRKLRRAGLAGALLRGDARRLPFADESLAAVVCTFPTPFIFEWETLAELRRVLQPGAAAIVVLSGALDGRGPLRLLIRGLYWLSGQTSAPHNVSGLCAQLGNSGLEARMEEARLADSAAQLLIMTKPPK